MRPSDLTSKLRGFVSLAQHLSFHAAAKELGVTQPALSAQIRALEESFGVKLFSRTTRTVKLTPHGERCLFRARRLLADTDAAVADMRNLHAFQSEVVSFACIPSIVVHLFPRLIRELNRCYPEAKVSMMDDTTISMERRLLAREVEFGIAGPPTLTDALEFRPVVEDPFVLVCPARHPLARRSRVSIRQILRYPLVSMSRGSNVHKALSGHFRRIGQTFSPAHELVHHHSVFSMVAANMGVALLPSMACSMIETPSPLRMLPLSDPTFTRPVGLIKRRGEPLSPGAHNLYLLATKTIHAAQPSLRRH